jgi:hypothetical protein
MFPKAIESEADGKALQIAQAVDLQYTCRMLRELNNRFPWIGFAGVPIRISPT